MKEGWVKKQGGRNKTWKTRYFVLDPEKLQVQNPKNFSESFQYFEDKTKKKPLGTVYLDEITEVATENTMTKAGAYFFQCVIPGRTLLMVVKEEVEVAQLFNFMFINIGQILVVFTPIINPITSC